MSSVFTCLMVRIWDDVPVIRLSHTRYYYSAPKALQQSSLHFLKCCAVSINTNRTCHAKPMQYIRYHTQNKTTAGKTTTVWYPYKVNAKSPV